MQFLDRRPALLGAALACAVVLNLWCLAHNITLGALLSLSAGCLLAGEWLIPETDLFEIPIAAWRVCGVNLPIGGGAWLRLLPLPCMRAGLAFVNAFESRPVTLYMHPWEIDHYQPQFVTDWKSHIRQTWGLDGMEGRLVSLLRASRFSTILDVHSEHLPAAATVPALRMQPQPLARAS